MAAAATPLRLVKLVRHSGRLPKGDALYGLTTAEPGHSVAVPVTCPGELKPVEFARDDVEFEFWRGDGWLNKEAEAAVAYDSKGDLPEVPRSRVDMKNKAIGFVYEYSNFGYFSNWFPAPIVVDGVYYNNTEEYYIESKVRLFCDEELLREVGPKCRDREAYEKNLPPSHERQTTVPQDFFSWVVKNHGVEIEELSDEDTVKAAGKFNAELLAAMRQGFKESPHPGWTKHCGRLTAGFDKAKWAAAEEYAEQAMLKACREKFKTHTDLGELLVLTDPFMLCEAARFDPLWGIGMSVDGRSNFPRPGDPKEGGGTFGEGERGTAVGLDWTQEYDSTPGKGWRGKNLLGKVLMRIRSELTEAQ